MPIALLKKVVWFIASKLINNPIVVILFHFIIFYSKKIHGIVFALSNDSTKEKKEVNNNEIPSVDNGSNAVDDDGSVYREENGIKQTIRPGEYVQPCGAFEVLSIEASSYKSLNTAMALWFESRSPIKPGDVFDALWMVSRNVPHLQFCISKRGGRYWLKRMLKLEIDFEISTKPAMEVHHEMLDAKYNLRTGPLWKTKLIFPADKSDGNKFTAVLIFGISHAIIDGVTQLNIAREFTKLMNSITSNEIIKPSFSPVITAVDRTAIEPTSIAFLAKIYLSKFYLVLIKQFHKEASFSGSFPIPKTTEATTKILVDDFATYETDVITRLCKKEMITVNSFIITLMNTALLNVAQSRSKTPIGKRDIMVSQCVNLRRHIDSKYRNVSGLHITLLDVKYKTYASDINDIWSVARRNHSSTNHLIEEKQHLKTIPILESLGLLFRVNKYFTKMGVENLRISHYITSNMGNLKNFMIEAKEEDNLKITYIIRDVAVPHSGSAFLLNFQTLNGKLMISMDYCTNVMKEEIATEVFRCLCQHIRNIAKNDYCTLKT